MAGEKQNTAESKGVYKNDIYREFVRWSALPPFARKEEGINNQNAFAEKYGVNKDTLTRWKNRHDFEPRVDQLLKQWGVGKTPDVLHAMYRSAVKGNSASQLLWLQYFKHFTRPKRKRKEEKDPITFGPDDIRGIIFSLPEPYKSKHLGLLRDLLSDITKLAKESSEESVLSRVNPEDWIHPDDPPDPRSLV